MRIYANLKNFLYLDIETVREYATYAEFLKNKNEANWLKFAKRFMEDEGLTAEQAYLKKAALYVEYAKVVCVAFATLDENQNEKIGAIADEDEKAALNKVADYLHKFYEKYPNAYLCGHNIKEFDVPFLIKRMILHNIRLPLILQNFVSAKSWDQKVADTQWDWRMNGNRFTSLDGIAEFLGIPSSKIGEVNGENLGEFYWNPNMQMTEKLQKIGTYCKEDLRVEIALTKRLYNSL